MVNTSFCSQCGPGGRLPTGVLSEKRPNYIDVVGSLVKTSWERVGAMCDEHLRINGDAAMSSGMEIKIEPLNQARIESNR